MQNQSNSNNSISSYEAYINNINNQMAYYYVFVSSAIGITGNLISMIIFIRLGIKNPKINMGLLYSCQTAIDMTMIIFGLLVFRGSPYLFGYLVLNLNDAFCKIFMFLRRFMFHASSFMSVIISFDRFIFVFYEHRFRFMKNKLILSAIIFGVMFIVALADGLNFFYYIGGTSKTSVLFTCIATNDIAIASDILSMLLRTYIPLILMVVFNCLMIYYLYKSSGTARIVQNSSLMRKEHQFTIAAISCDVFFFLCNFPLSVFYFFYDANLYSGAFKTDSTLSAVFSFYQSVFLNISLVFQSCSIVLYVVFNKLFRQELFMIPCIAKNFRFVDVDPSVTNDQRKNNSQKSLY